MAEPEDEFVYGLVPDDPPRKPLRHRTALQLERSRLGSDPRLLNRGTVKATPNKATENRSVPSRPIPPLSERLKGPSAEEVKQLLDELREEDLDRLKPQDGYNPIPPRPHDGPGLRLRPQYDDINEYFTGPKWLDPNTRPFLETAESTLDSPPYTVSNPELQYREEGRKIYRRKPKKKPTTPAPQPKPAPPPPPPFVFPPKTVRFKSYTLPKWPLNYPHEIVGGDSLIAIAEVAIALQKHPDKHVRLTASVGADVDVVVSLLPSAFINYIKDGRNNVVEGILRASGVDKSRIHLVRGVTGEGDPYKRVQMTIIDPP